MLARIRQEIWPLTPTRRMCADIRVNYFSSDATRAVMQVRRHVWSWSQGFPELLMTAELKSDTCGCAW